MELRIESLKEIMRLRKISAAKLAQECGISESTLKKLLSGEVADPRISTLYGPVKFLGASIDRLVGLAPPRDFDEEKRVYDENLMTTMQQRVELQDAKLAAQSEQIERQQTKLHEYEVQISTQAERLAHRDETIREQAQQIARQRRSVTACVVILLVLLAIIAYGVWEIVNLDKGLTALLYPDVVK